MSDNIRKKKPELKTNFSETLEMRILTVVVLPGLLNKYFLMETAMFPSLTSQTKDKWLKQESSNIQKNRHVNGHWDATKPIICLLC